MKKTIFIGISLLSISICIDDVWSAPIRRYSTGSIKGGVSRQGSISQNFQSRRNSTGNMGIQEPINVRPESVKSFLANIKLEKSMLNELQDIIDKVPSEDIRVLRYNIENFNRSQRGNDDNNAKKTTNKLEKAGTCLSELISTRDVIISELQYKTKESGNSLDSVVSLTRIIENLNNISINKLSNIISICEKEKISKVFTENLKKFSNRVNELKRILKEINNDNTLVVCTQIEGIPELNNLKEANTLLNQKLAEKQDSSYEVFPSYEGSANDTLLSGSLYQEPEEYIVHPSHEQATNDVLPSYNASSSQESSTPQQKVGQTGTESNADNATISPPMPAQSGQQSGMVDSTSNAVIPPETPVQSGQQSGTEGSTSNAVIPSVTPAQSGQQSGTEGSTSNAVIPPVTPAQSGQQSGTVDSTSNAVIPPETPVQSGQQSGTEGSTSNAGISQVTPGQQPATENGNATVPPVAPVPQNTVQTTDGSNLNTTNQGSSGQPQNTVQSAVGDSSNNAISQGFSTQQPAVENSTNNASVSQLTPAQSGQQSGTEGSTSNAVIPPVTPAQSGQQSGTVDSTSNAVAPQITPEQRQNAGQTVGESNPSTATSVTPAQQDTALTSTASNSVVNTINREDPKKFYALLEQDIGLLKDEDLQDKKKRTTYEKVRDYLNKAKSERNFEERVSDVQRIIRAYNSLVALIPKTKDGKRLNTVPIQKIKSLRETIYSEVFDDLKSRMEKLKSDARFGNLKTDIDNFVKLNERNKAEFFDNSFFDEFLEYIEKNKKEVNFVDFLKAKGKNTESFEIITSDREKRAGRSDRFSKAFIYDNEKARLAIAIYRRGLMFASVNAYDQLIEKIWRETGVDHKTVDLVGPALYDGVILSIDG